MDPKQVFYGNFDIYVEPAELEALRALEDDPDVATITWPTYMLFAGRAAWVKHGSLLSDEERATRNPFDALALQALDENRRGETTPIEDLERA